MLKVVKRLKALDPSRVTSLRAMLAFIRAVAEAAALAVGVYVVALNPPTPGDP